jgi:hypothetical protein
MLKVNDKVFDYILQEWGVVTEIEPTNSYPVVVDFQDDDHSYLDNGAFDKDNKLPRLSLTAWNPIEGTGKYTPISQSQESETTEIDKIWAAIEELKQNQEVRNNPPQNRQPQIGDMVYGWDQEGGNIFYGRLNGLNNGSRYPFSVDDRVYKFTSLTRPSWIP